MLPVVSFISSVRDVLSELSALCDSECKSADILDTCVFWFSCFPQVANVLEEEEEYKVELLSFQFSASETLCRYKEGEQHWHIVHRLRQG
jgi:hypothetical protein